MYDPFNYTEKITQTARVRSRRDVCHSRSESHDARGEVLGSAPALADDDDPFIVLTETKFSFRCIPVGIGTLLTGLGSTKKHM
jgi:hypothetical protein